VGAPVAFAHDDRSDEVGVAGQEDNHNERSRQRQIDNRQLGEEHPFVIEGRKLDQELVEVHSRFAEQSDEADREREIERGQKEPAREQEALDCVFDHRSPGGQQ
jgi:hypothetical protein